MNKMYSIHNFLKERKRSLDIDRFIQGGHGFEKAEKIVPFFYYFLLFIAFSKLEGLNYSIAHPQMNFSARWPIFWADYFSYSTTVTAVLVFFVFSALIGAYFYRNRVGRAAAFVGILQYHAFMSSFGGPNHQWDLWLWVAFLFMFLPDAWNKKKQSLEIRKKFLLVFWGAQAFVLLTYSMSGIGKVYGAIAQYIHGEAHIFAFDAAALHITSLLNTMQETTVLGPLILNYPLLGWLFFVGVIYLQFFAFFVAFRPSLHKVWALGLILFHIGTFLAMRAIFVSPVALLLILFFGSPFYKSDTSWRNMLSDFPLFGWVLRRLLVFKSTAP